MEHTRQHVAATHRSNQLPCVYWRIFVKSFITVTELCLATSQTKSDQTEFVWLVVATKFCCWDKDFHKKSPVHTLCDLLLQSVVQLSTRPVHTEWFALRLLTATCHLLCPDLKSYHTAALVYLQSDPPVFPEPAVLLFQHVLLQHLVVLCLLIKRTSK